MKEVIGVPALCRAIPIDRRVLRKRLALGIVKADILDRDRGPLFFVENIEKIRCALADSMDFGGPVNAVPVMA